MRELLVGLQDARSYRVPPHVSSRRASIIFGEISGPAEPCVILRLARAGSDLVAFGVKVDSGGRDVGMAQHLLDHRQAVCGTEFEGIAKRIYDRSACQVRAYRLHKRERIACPTDIE